MTLINTLYGIRLTRYYRYPSNIRCILQKRDYVGQLALWL